MRASTNVGPWVGPGYGLGVVIGETALGPRVVGHTGKGPGSVIAVYHTCDRVPAVTTAAFTTGGDSVRVEEAAFATLSD
jgi:hypothetical protein